MAGEGGRKGVGSRKDKSPAARIRASLRKKKRGGPGVVWREGKKRKKKGGAKKKKKALNFGHSPCMKKKKILPGNS